VRPDAVVLDWRMPGGGLGTARRMIEDHGMAGRLIMVTGLDDLRDRRAAHKAGVWCYLVKPIDQDELLRAVDAAVRGRLEQRLLEPTDPAPPVKLDPRPLEGLRRYGAFERNEVLSSVIVTISQVLEEITSAVARADMAAIARLAHRGVNDSAAVGAGRTRGRVRAPAGRRSRRRAGGGARCVRAPGRDLACDARCAHGAVQATVSRLSRMIAAAVPPREPGDEPEIDAWA
jgi:hypothetical protein